METNKEVSSVGLNLNKQHDTDNDSEVAEGGFETRRTFSDFGSNDSECFNDVGLTLPGDEDQQNVDDDFDPVFEQIKDSIRRRSQAHSASTSSMRSTASDDGPQVRVSEQFLSIPFGIQARASYEHGKRSSDIMGGVYALKIL